MEKREIIPKKFLMSIKHFTWIWVNIIRANTHSTALNNMAVYFYQYLYDTKTRAYFMAVYCNNNRWCLFVLGHMLDTNKVKHK